MCCSLQTERQVAMIYPMIVPAYRYIPQKPDDIILFLAGPVLGGGEWQETFLQALFLQTVWTDSFRDKMLKRLKVIVPCRWGDNHSLAGHFCEVYEKMKTGDSYLDSQTMWEIHYIKRIVCLENGFVVFGLFSESKTYPRNDGQPYARDTFGEIGRYTTMAGFKHTIDSILVGYDSQFPGINVQKKNFRYFLPSKWNKNNVKEIINMDSFVFWVANEIMRRYANA